MYEKFKKIIDTRGITPYKISKETGISQVTLSDWKRNKSNPKTDKLKKIAEYLGVAIEDLI